MNRSFSTIITLTALTASALISVAALANDDPEILTDPSGDAIVRRTDLGNDGTINPLSNLPDLIRIEIGGWQSTTPTSNRFNGVWDDYEDTGLFRVNLVFQGLINPPGPIALNEPTYDPFRFGPNPVYGFIEFDVDDDLDTGGDIDNIYNRFLGNVSRFGGSVDSDLGKRAALSVDDLDGDLLTAPLVERSGEEWHLALCGCDPITVVNTFNDQTPNSFDPGDKWIVSSRFIHRSHAFTEFSFAFGGSRSGEYDPLTFLQFDSRPGQNITIVSLVEAIDQRGAGILAGAPSESIDLDASNQTSIHELINDIQFAAINAFDPGVGSAFDLLRDWSDGSHDNLTDFLDPESWKINALLGTAYTTEQPDAHYVWTDLAFDFVPGDVTGNGSANTQDLNAISNYIKNNDAGPTDADGVLNGQVRFPSFGFNFFIADLDYDGAVNALDLSMIQQQRPGDINADQTINNQDLILLRTLIGLQLTDPAYNPAADLNHDGIINRSDTHQLRMILRLQHLNSN